MIIDHGQDDALEPILDEVDLAIARMAREAIEANRRLRNERDQDHQVSRYDHLHA